MYKCTLDYKVRRSSTKDNLRYVARTLHEKMMAISCDSYFRYSENIYPWRKYCVPFGFMNMRFYISEHICNKHTRLSSLPNSLLLTTQSLKSKQICVMIECIHRALVY